MRATLNLLATATGDRTGVALSLMRRLSPAGRNPHFTEQQLETTNTRYGMKTTRLTMKHLVSAVALAALAPGCEAPINLDDIEENVEPADQDEVEEPDAQEAELNGELAADASDEDDDAVVVDANLELHMRFGPEVTKEEADARFEEAFHQHLAAQTAAQRQQKFYFKISHRTGNNSGDQTDARVEGKVYLKMSSTNINSGWLNLDAPGDDRKRNAYDSYMFSMNTAGASWVEFRRVPKIRLKGKDGWRLRRDWGVEARPSWSPGASGTTTYWTSTESFFLDNLTSWGWDYTGDIWANGAGPNGGRVYF